MCKSDNLQRQSFLGFPDNTPLISSEAFSLMQLHHESLASRHSALAAKQERIAALQARLEKYKGMPADLGAAHQLYADTSAKLQEATKQFDDGMAQL